MIPVHFEWIVFGVRVVTGSRRDASLDYPLFRRDPSADADADPSCSAALALRCAVEATDHDDSATPKTEN